MLSSVYHTGPVTALSCVNASVLAGIGSKLHIYRLQPEVQHIGTYSVLPGRVIHGIRQEPYVDERDLKLCVFGQKCLRVIHYDQNSYEVQVNTDLVLFDDWIWDVAWLQGGERLSIALGHNVIVIWDVVNRMILTTTDCAEKCILYCAKFLTNQEDQVVLAAGTVFNQVVLWSSGSSHDNGRIEPFHRLTGHQGVIFSVDYDAVSQRICSVSDDRSVRLYQVKFPHTGNDCFLTAWENIETSLLHVLFGHSARVWDVRLMSSVFVSVGEDATCCVWNYDGKVIQKFKGHKGKSIWSLAVDKKEQFIVTGGGDCSIRLWKVEEEDTDMHVNTESIGLQLNVKDFPRSVQFLKDGYVLVMTNEGLLVMYDIHGKSSQCIMKEEEFASYSVLSVSPSRLIAAIGNIHGTLRLLYWNSGDKNDPEMFDSVVYQGRICSVIWLDNDNILTSGPNGEATVWRILLHYESRSLQQLARFELPASKHRWASSAIFSQDMSHVICGDRGGSVILYNMEGQLIQIFPKIHKADVTHVCLHGNQVYTTGRDGIYRLYDWEENKLTLLNSSKVFKGFGWIERLTVTEGGDLLIQGFNANKFIVWSVYQNQKLLEVESGGGHRSWDFLLDGCHGNSAQLLYIKAREVLLKDIQLKSNQVIIRSCLHGRELCDVKHISVGTDRSGNPVHLLATCSEDTLVCLASLSYNEHNQQDLCVFHSLSGHISSVRCLAMCESASLSSHDPKMHRKLLFSGGGRAQIKVWRLDVCKESSDVALKTLKPVLHAKTSLSEDIVKEKDESLATKHCQDTESASCYKISHVNDIISSVISKDAEIENRSCDDLTQSSQDVSNVNKPCLQYNSPYRPTVHTLESDLTDSSEKNKTLQSNSAVVNECSGNISVYQRPGEERCIFRCEEANFSEQSEQTVDKESAKSVISCQYESLAGVQLGCDKRRKRKPWRLKEDNSDPETRILDLTVFSAQELSSDYPEWLYFLTAACSDGLIRFFLFEEDSGEVTFITSSNFHDHCVLKVKHIIHRSEKTMSVLIVSAATDGRVAFWDVTGICKSVIHKLASKENENKHNLSEVKVFFEKKLQLQSAMKPDMPVSVSKSGESVHRTEDRPTDPNYEEGLEKLKLVPVCCLSSHQSGINGIFFGFYEANSYILVTGGDDNAIQVSLIIIEDSVVMETDSQRKVKVICTGSVPSAHTAQITGIWYLGQNLIVTVSIDQRICLWYFTTEDSIIKLELIDCKFIDIPDIANIDVWRQRQKIFMAVCGEGLEVLEINVESLEKNRTDTAAKNSEI